MLALKPVLQSHGVSQADLARLVELSPATIAQWINREIWPKSPNPHELMQRVAVVLEPKGIAINGALFEPIPTAPTDGMDIKTAATTNEQQSLTEEVISMLLRKQTLTPQARKAFGLFRDPFDNDIESADDVFLTPDSRYVREYLWQTAKSGGFMAIIGESGAGKSTLRKDLEERIYREDAPILVMSPYILGMEDNDKKGKTLKAASLADAMIHALDPLGKPRQTMEAKGRQLHTLLKSSRKAGFSHVLVIEEAHGLHTQTLKHLKRFFELEDGFKKLLSIVLIGQTELKTKLSERSPEVREVVLRCEVVELMPLDSQLEAYLRFKFERVGKSLDEVFDKNALDGIRSRLMFTTGGKERQVVSLMYPLMINNLVTAALNAAASLGFANVTADLIREA